MPRRSFSESFFAVLESWGIKKTSTVPTRSGRELRLYLPLPDGSRVLVGILTQDQGEFAFKYADEFRARTDLPPISSFPEKDQEYRSETLWPFFQVRIPPTDRPDVERVMRERRLDPRDTFALLGELGRRTISTPYEFVPS